MDQKLKLSSERVPYHDFFFIFGLIFFRLTLHYPIVIMHISNVISL